MLSTEMKAELRSCDCEACERLTQKEWEIIGETIRCVIRSENAAMNEKNRITEQAEQELVKEQMRLNRKIHEWLLEEENDAPDIQEAERVGKALEAVNDERLELLQKQVRAVEAHRKATERIQYAHILYDTWGEKRQTQTTYPEGGYVAQIFGLLAESIELLEEEIGPFMMQPSEAETTPAE